MDTILIVEDHELVRRSLREWLEHVFPGCIVVEARTGEEALAAARACAPCVVVMDISLPGMSGIETTRRIKAIQPTVQVVMLTIHEDDPYRAEALAAGVSAYVTKRKMQAELIPALAKLLPKPANRSLAVAAVQVILTLLLTLAASGCASPARPAPLTRVTVQLSWLHQAEFAGLYAAEQQGYFAAEGLHRSHSWKAGRKWTLLRRWRAARRSRPT
jgi:DNA-binding NarL/FixJ family response regulator